MSVIHLSLAVQSNQPGNGGNWPSKVPGHKSGGIAVIVKANG